jgi:hypothetical protein
MAQANLQNVLIYHRHNEREWLIHGHNRSFIPKDLTEKVMQAVREHGVTLANGQRFKVEAKSKASKDGIFMQIEDAGEKGLEISVLPPQEERELIIDFLVAPQTLADWKAWLIKTTETNPGFKAGELIESVMSAQVFEFGEVDEHWLIKENARAFDLMQKGFLKLPYDCVVYRYTGSISGRSHLIAKQDGIVLVWQKPGQTDHLVASLSLMLATRGTILRTEQPSVKLQAKREARGKSALPTVTYVNAEHYVIAARNTEAKGTHTSPVPHLRRGHLRTLANGHTTWIRDMLVNCKSVDEAVRRKLYIIKETQHD